MVHKLFYSYQGKIILLFMLYFSQGLPFGFQATALPLYLRDRGVSLTVIGFATALALPWLLKALWAPLVDRFWSAKIGRRKSWIIPLQVLLIITIFASSQLDPAMGLWPLFISVFLMNLFAATQDIAVDGLAVDILRENELGTGNAAQVVGYKTGMVVSGGLLVWASRYIGWNGLFTAMALCTVMPLVILLPFNENNFFRDRKTEHQSIKEIIAAVAQAFRIQGALWLVLFIASYKFGEIMIDIMFKPFLVDAGFTPSKIGLWVGTFGMAASIAGSLSGGIIASRTKIIKALYLALALRIVPLVLEWLLTVIEPSDTMVIITTLSEHLFGGMLTTAMFAFMMSRVDKTIGATHYTILASIEVLGKSPGAWVSGLLADTIGYNWLFGIGVLISAAVILIVPKMKKYENN